MWLALRTPETLFVIALFLVAFTIRAVGIDWGLPGQQYPHSQFVQDETAELYGALQLSKGVYQMGLLKYQPFFYYLTFATFMLYFLVGLLTGRFSNLADFQAQYGVDLSQFFIAGRLFMAAVGALTVVLTYYVGKYMFGRRAGAVAAVFLSISLGHVVYSKIVRLDSLLPLLFLLAFYLIIRLKEARPGKLRPYVLCGLAVAAAATTKTTGFALVAPLLAVPLVEGWITLRWPPKLSGIDRRYPFSLTVLFAALIALTAPYFVYLSALRAGTRSAAAGVARSVTRRFGTTTAFANSYALSPYRWSLPWHLTSTLPQQLGVPIFVMAIAGLAWMIFDRGRRRVAIYLFITLFAFLLPVGLMVRAPWRDTLPLLPLLAIAAGYGLVSLSDFLVSRFFEHGNRAPSKLVPTVILILVALVPLVTVIRQQKLILKSDTRDIARDWIEENIPAGSHIAIEPFGPGILDTGYREEIKEASAQYRGLPDLPSYEISMVVEEVGEALPATELRPFLVDGEVEYLVTSSAYYGRFYNQALDAHAPQLSHEGRAMHDAIESSLELAAQFIPDRTARPGPVIKIYRVPPGMDRDALTAFARFEPYPGMERPASAVGYYQFVPR